MEHKAAVDTTEDNLIIVTGFGPFVGHEDLNASWEAVSLLPDTLKFCNKSYVIKKQKIDVEYNAVDSAVQEIWEQNPKLVLHCGVSGLAECVYVEKTAYNNKFTRPDYAGQCLRDCVAVNRDRCISDQQQCEFNVTDIVQYCVSKHEDLKEHCKDILKVSTDVGNYLCGYIYLKSLDIDPKRTIFIHVPRINEPFTSTQTAKLLLTIIEACLQQLCSES